MFWSVGGVGGLASAGFFYLLNLLNQKHIELDKLIAINSAQIEHRATTQYVHAQFYTKEIIDTHLKTIEKQLTMLGSALAGIDLKLDKIWEMKLVIKNGM